jgi:hypothetical protein
MACGEVNRDFVGFSVLAKYVVAGSLSVTIGELESVVRGDCIY